jgi:hypothetical protein
MKNRRRNESTEMGASLQARINACALSINAMVLIYFVSALDRPAQAGSL